MTVDPPNPESPTVERVGFTLHLRPDRVEDYLDSHQTVWPEMLSALSQAGWHNYSLFLHRETATIFGYVESPDFAQAQANIDATEANTAWQQHMSEFFDPDRPAFTRLPHYFHLP